MYTCTFSGLKIKTSSPSICLSPFLIPLSILPSPSFIPLSIPPSPFLSPSSLPLSPSSFLPLSIPSSLFPILSHPLPSFLPLSIPASLSLFLPLTLFLPHPPPLYSSLPRSFFPLSIPPSPSTSSFPPPPLPLFLSLSPSSSLPFLILSSLPLSLFLPTSLYSSFTLFLNTCTCTLYLSNILYNMINFIQHNSDNKGMYTCYCTNQTASCTTICITSIFFNLCELGKQLYNYYIHVHVHVHVHVYTHLKYFFCYCVNKHNFFIIISCSRSCHIDKCS